jgi:hypothetical protein
MATYALINSSNAVENWVVWDGVSPYAPLASDNKPATLVEITPENAVALAIPQPVVPAQASPSS